MSHSRYDSPLIGADSPLDVRSQDVLRTVYDAEWAKAQELPTDDPRDAKRRARVELTWKEMKAQSDAIRNTLYLERDGISETADFLARIDFERVYMTGCGDSVASMLGVRSLFEQVLGIPCEPLQALEFAYHYHRAVNERTLVITLSSSGATTRTVEAMMLARAMGAVTLALSNTEGSPLMVESDRGLRIHAERRGWPTQSSTAAMAILVQLVLEIGGKRGIDGESILAIRKAFDRIPKQMSDIVTNLNEQVREIAEAEKERRIYLYCGGGPAYASALFGAAKLRECSPNHAIAIELEEFHHYNSQKAGDPLFLMSPRGSGVSRALDTLHEGKRWGGEVYSVVTEGDAELFAESDQVLALADVPEVLSAFTFTVPVQLFAYHVSMAKFRDADES